MLRTHAASAQVGEHFVLNSSCYGIFGRDNLVRTEPRLGTEFSDRTFRPRVVLRRSRQVLQVDHVFAFEKLRHITVHVLGSVVAPEDERESASHSLRFDEEGDRALSSSGRRRRDGERDALSRRRVAADLHPDLRTA